MVNTSEYIKLCRFLNEFAIELTNEEFTFHVEYWGVTPEHYDNPVHRHSFFEICYVIEGEGSYWEEGTKYILGPGTLFCSRPGIWHQIRSEHGMGLLFVGYDLNGEQSSPEGIQLFRQMIEHNKVCISNATESITVQIWRALFSHTPSVAPSVSKGLVVNLAAALLTSFCLIFAEFMTSSVQQEYRGIESSLLKQAKLYIEDNLSRKLSLDHLAGYLHISRRHLSRLFADELGQSFVHYVQERRVHKSLELLKKTDWQMSRIAKETGFESIHYFTRVFTTKIGISPARFRKSQFSTTLHH